MVEKTATKRIELGLPNVELIQFDDIDNADTYQSEKFTEIRALILTANRAEAAADSFSATFSGQTVTFTAIGTTTNVPCTLLIIGGV